MAMSIVLRRHPARIESEATSCKMSEVTLLPLRLLEEMSDGLCLDGRFADPIRLRGVCFGSE